ncbi:hypothetical protein [Sphingomonas sp. SORGH_AS_0438]|uniref:hypothetical protein n=1 Tax=Sphingomonas sp. SORGH_AS_0438 TaxID=3041756 RepID=UPI0028656AA0|nr:hypothetical protein [Sphingomonas sp. SORGH_AS_0438]MDR6127093.1 hypothetical protein [Sphingomonas sp. SORGH_AS_0438]
MIEDDIRKLVDAHYEDDAADILLLSNIGMHLTDAGLWPPANDKRTLFDIVQSMDGVTLVRDETAKSFIAVVKTGEEQRAVQAIADRHKHAFLRGLPRALLLAFTLDIADGQIMTVRLDQKISYLAGPVAEDGAIVVDDDLRISGLDVINLRELSGDDIEKLDTNIRAWCERHHIDPASLQRTSRKAIKATTSLPADTVQASALERLYAAQDPDVAKRLSVPIDIALALSRMP